MRASHVLIKHCESRNPVSRRTDLSTENVTVAAAREELSRWRDELLKDSRPMPEKFAALAHHRSDCGSFQAGGDLGEFGPGEMQEPFEQATISLPIGEVSDIVSTDSGLHLIYRTARSRGLSPTCASSVPRTRALARLARHLELRGASCSVLLPYQRRFHWAPCTARPGWKNRRQQQAAASLPNRPLLAGETPRARRRLSLFHS